MATETRWVDLPLHEAVDEMAVGEMIHRADFQLFDAMSALELMDP